jgi:hypothetical protein
VFSGGAAIELQEVDVASTPAADLPAQLEQASTQVGAMVLQILLSLSARQLGDAMPAQTLRVSVPVDGAVAGRMSEFEDILGALPDVADEAVGNVAALWLAVCEQLPFVAGGRGTSASSPYPVLRSVLGLLPMLPAVSTSLAGPQIGADVTVDDGTLTLEITIN